MAYCTNINELKQRINDISAVNPVPTKQYLVNREAIPNELKEKHQWVCWVARNRKPNGKFDKVPVDPKSGRFTDGTNLSNWMSFEDACAHYDNGKCDGIGIGLLGEPFCKDQEGQPLYLIALDFDGVANRPDEVREVWNSLGKPYTEISPSGNGLRMFALSRVLIAGGNDGRGHEMYSSGRFVTVTGNVIGGCHD